MDCCRNTSMNTDARESHGPSNRLAQQQDSLNRCTVPCYADQVHPDASLPSLVAHPMVVFGIDPGSTVTGWAVISHARGRLSFINGGAIKTHSKTPMGERLLAIHEGLLGALRRHSYDEVAIEAIFKHKSAESAIRLGQARGVALLAAASLGFEPVPYNAMTVKATVGCHGKADKKAVARMVTALLGTTPEGPADVTDACAIAITHCLRGPGRRLMGPPQGRRATVNR